MTSAFLNHSQCFGVQFEKHYTQNAIYSESSTFIFLWMENVNFETSLLIDHYHRYRIQQNTLNM